MPKKSNRQREIPTLESVLQDCYQLSLTEMIHLRDALNVLILEEQEWLENLDEGNEWEMRREEKLPYTGARGSRGHIELKMINNCGPYAYLRFRSGETHHSFYLGKAKR
jgi:hypothetical protein